MWLKHLRSRSLHVMTQTLQSWGSMQVLLMKILHSKSWTENGKLAINMDINASLQMEYFSSGSSSKDIDIEDNHYIVSCSVMVKVTVLCWKCMSFQNFNVQDLSGVRNIEISLVIYEIVYPDLLDVTIFHGYAVWWLAFCGSARWCCCGNRIVVVF